MCGKKLLLPLGGGPPIIFSQLYLCFNESPHFQKKTKKTNQAMNIWSVLLERSFDVDLFPYKNVFIFDPKRLFYGILKTYRWSTKFSVVICHFQTNRTEKICSNSLERALIDVYFPYIIFKSVIRNEDVMITQADRW